MEITAETPKIVVIVGQTGSGKTALSLDLAERYNGEVINADSRQVYKGLDIGTEKITKEQMRGVPHHLLDIIDPANVYTAASFKRDAQSAIRDITSSGKLPIIAGGTFFYIDTLLEKTSAPEVPPDPEYRAELETKSTHMLYEELSELDPIRAAAIDMHNKRRLMRALEIVRALGRVPKSPVLECPYEVLTIGLSVPREVLKDRLRARAEHALERGLIAETEGLLRNGVSKERLSEIGLEYKLVLEHLEGVLTREELLQRLQEKNWQYAKRQMVWLKRDNAISWHAPEDRAAIFAETDAFLAV